MYIKGDEYHCKPPSQNNHLEPQQHNNINNLHLVYLQVPECYQVFIIVKPTFCFISIFQTFHSNDIISLLVQVDGHYRFTDTIRDIIN